MSTYLPTIKQLQYLVALHEHGHFGRAAEASFVSQSTLSAGIRELESLLGVTLVERSRRVSAIAKAVCMRAEPCHPPRSVAKWRQPLPSRVHALTGPLH